MLHRLSLLALPLLALLLAFTQESEPPTAPDEEAAKETAIERQPNVVVVVIDDMAWEDLDTTPVPVLERLMEEGRVYEDFYVCPVCSPSRAALQFGRYSIRDGVVGAISAREEGNVGMPLERIAIPEVLGPAGYATAIFGKWHVSTMHETKVLDAARQHGYETWRAGHPTNLGPDGGATHSSWLRVDDGVLSHSNVYSGLAITDAFIEWWQGPEERPRFAVVSYLTPHEPFTTPPDDLLPPGCVMGKDARTRYQLSVSALDTLIGRVADTIDLENTYLFVLSDNGTPHQVHPPLGRYRGYKHTSFQGGVHVPLIVLGPGVVKGRSPHLAHIVDVPRTIFELCDVQSEEGFEDSRSFAASLHKEMPPREPVFVHARSPNNSEPAKSSSWAVVDSKGWKLLNTNGKESLFHLRRDPTEATPINAPREADRLRAVVRSVVPE